MINERWQIHTMDYYSAIKTNELSIPAATHYSKNLRQMHEARRERLYIVWVHLSEMSGKGKFVKTESTSVVA